MTDVRCVLVVEPDVAVADDLGTSLSLVSDTVVVVQSAPSAIAWLAENDAPDAAVIDLQVADLATVVALLRRRATAPLPVFYVSRDPTVAPRFGGAPVLSVPFEPIEARAVLTETLMEHQAWRDHYSS